jgi:predicted metalloprotease with PDZ domain
LYEVQVTVDDPDESGQRFRLPTWVPGSYLIREFARHFVRVRATCAGEQVALQKTAKDTWQAAPCAGPLTVVADVYAFDLSVRAAYLDATRGYFNGAVLFLCPAGRASVPCTVEIAAPEAAVDGTWRVATTLERDGAVPYGFGTYRAASYDELIDHPVETSAFALTSFTAAGIAHDVAVSGRQQCDLARLGGDLERICAAQVELFGQAPFDRYLFQVMAVGDGYGGLEHRTSTSLLCRRDELPRRGVEEIDDDYLSFLGLASHEYFLAWTVKRIKPAAFTPYDLSAETYTRQLWAFEGITSYYDDLMLARCGLIGFDRYLELLARTITSVLRTPGRHLQAAADSSFDAWIKFYRQSENSANAEVSYYAKGAMIACALDLTLRARGETTLDQVMRALWLRHGQPGIGVPEDGIPTLVSELAGQDMSEFFARYVDGTEDPPLRELLAAHGVAMHLRVARDGKDRGGEPATGGLPACTLGVKLGNGDRLVAVFGDGPAARAGLSAGDVLMAIDGIKFSPERLQALMTHAAPGTRVAIHAFRRDELASFDVTLAAAPEDVCYLACDADAAPAIVARRNAWLTGSA